ncbi:RNA polymerase sigma factor [Caldalkalibacillus mannanilyticus]|uniref:RNA polymerase sigma factor n=1 Tax=Caldalkalibacillus mannanilyticus TaxID=1418 RepID=UPI0005512560|nr:sigma-70 family RNA polymerase sigma factor [Caldalkalibacillus mannanilyticus]
MDSLVEQAKQGSKEAFTLLIRKIELDLYRISKSILKRDADCEDAIQETILLAYDHLPSLKQAAYFKTWITRILIHECYSIIQAHKKIIPVSEIIESKNPANDYTQIEVKEMLGRLKEDIRLTAILYYIHDFNTKEIATILDIPQGTVKSRLSRAREQLKKELLDKTKEVKHG